MDINFRHGFEKTAISPVVKVLVVKRLLSGIKLKRFQRDLRRKAEKHFRNQGDWTKAVRSKSLGDERHRAAKHDLALFSGEWHKLEV